MTTSHKQLNLPSPNAQAPKSIKIGSSEFQIDVSQNSASNGVNGLEAINRLQKALTEGVFIDLPDTENDKTDK